MELKKGLVTARDEAYSMLSQFYQYDSDVPLDARIYNRDVNEGHIRERIVFQGAREGRVPIYLALPNNQSPPYPAVFLLHGLGASKEDWWTAETVDERLARELLATGHAVCALDVPFHGERTHVNDYQTPWGMIVDHVWVNKYREMLVESVLEHRRAMDYLTMRPEIDSERFGILGRSVGGLVAYILTAVDPRIKAAVAASTMPMSDYYVDTLGWDKSAVDRLAPVAPRTFAPRIKNAAFLMLNGTQDPYGTSDDLRLLHDLVGSSVKRLIFIESGHRLPAEYIPSAVDWFRKHL